MCKNHHFYLCSQSVIQTQVIKHFISSFILRRMLGGNVPHFEEKCFVPGSIGKIVPDSRDGGGVWSKKGYLI